VIKSISPLASSRREGLRLGVCVLRRPPAGSAGGPDRQLNANDQSMRLPIVERQLACVRQHDTAHDRKSKTEARRLTHVPGVVAAHKWFEHDIFAGIADAGTIVLNLDGHRIRRHSKADHDLRSEPDRVLDKVGNAAMQIVGSKRGRSVFWAVISNFCVPCRRTDRRQAAAWSRRRPASWIRVCYHCARRKARLRASIASDRGRPACGYDGTRPR